jgi:hypothetical protein
MVCARLLSEVTVLIALLGLPVFLVIIHKLHAFPPAVQGMFFAVAMIALLILPGYGFITWMVKTEEGGVTARALLVKKSCQWSKLKGLARRASWNSLRFVVEYDGGTLSFPVLIEKCDQLVEEIRSHLPKGVGIQSEPQRIFVYDRITLFVQLLQSVTGIIFVGIFWLFFASKMHHGNGGSDALIIFVFCAICTVVILCRFWLFLIMPQRIQINPSDLTVRTCFGERRIDWKDVLAIGMPLPTLPSGFTVKTKQGTIYIGCGVDAADELQNNIQQKVSIRKEQSPAKLKKGKSQ